METSVLNKKSYSRLGFAKSETDAIVEKLNLVLSNYHVFYQKLRNFHWNVTGDDFFDLHENFEKYYTEAIENIDEIAERIRVFGQTPTSTFTEYLQTSEIKEVGTGFKAKEMAVEVLKDFEILVRYMDEAAQTAADEGDTVTEDMLIGFIKEIEKNHWMLNSWAK